ncbi:MAG: hypothetical protein WBA74_06350 [Cyclobacteriaceae bacterium]
MTAPISFYNSLSNDEFDFFFNNSFDILSKQKFTINELPGIYFELQENDKKYYYFYYGDSAVENRILGVLPDGSNQLPKIFDFVQNSYYDRNAIVDPLENAKFRIYPSIIGFNYASHMMNQYLYFEEGYEEYTKSGEQFNAISISQLSRNTSREDIDNVFEIMVSQMVNQGIEIKEVLFNDTLTVDESYAKAIGFEAKYDDSERVVYILTTGKNNTIVNVTGNFHHDGMELIPKIHSMASEMRITGGNK